MAQVTSQIGSFANNLVVVEIDWNDANGSIIRARIINSSAFPAHMEAVLDPPINGFTVVGTDGPANQTTVNNLPNNTVKMTKVIDPDDGSTGWSLIGVSLFCRWPA